MPTTIDSLYLTYEIVFSVILIIMMFKIERRLSLLLKEDNQSVTK